MSDTLLKKLEVLNYQGLWLKTGAVKITPIQWCYTPDINPLMLLSRRWLFHYTLNLFKRMDLELIINISYRNLKIQNGFIQKVKEGLVKMDLPFQLEKQVKLTNPLDCQKINVRFCLAHENEKCLMRKFHRYFSSLCVKVNGYLLPWTPLAKDFTDGSFVPEHPNAGAGISWNLFTFGIPVGTNRKAFDNRTVIAIRVAFEELFSILVFFRNVVILSEGALCSIPCLDTLSTCDILICQESIRKLHQLGKTDAFQWIFGHCGIAGNERPIICKLHQLGKTDALQWILGHCGIAGNERLIIWPKLVLKFHRL